MTNLTLTLTLIHNGNNYDVVPINLYPIPNIYLTVCASSRRFYTIYLSSFSICYECGENVPYAILSTQFVITKCIILYLYDKTI